MKTHVAFIAGAAGILALAGWGAWSWMGAAPSPGVLQPVAGESQPISEPGTVTPGPRSAERRAVIPAEPTREDPGAIRDLFQGRVFDTSGSPLAGVVVHAVPANQDVRATSAADGSKISRYCTALSVTSIVSVWRGTGS